MIVAVLLAVSVSVFQSWSAGAPGTGGWTQTQWGPLSSMDRDFLQKVRMAGLWEQPTGQQAAQQASTPQVREIGQHISSEHATLDADVRKVADQLGVLLPTSPSAQQQAWMAEISAQTGSAYDRTFVQRLREAHGIVLALIAQVRASTRNDMVRAFAATANEFVSRHMRYLEDTGLVNYMALPDPPSPGLFSSSATGPELIVPILIFVAALLAALALFSAMRKRKAVRPRRDPVSRQPAPPQPGPALMAITAGPSVDDAGPPQLYGSPNGASVEAPLSPAYGTALIEPSRPYHRTAYGTAPGESTGATRRSAYGTAPGESTGATRRSAYGTPPGESTGSHPRPAYGTSPGESTGSRHAIRR